MDRLCFLISGQFKSLVVDIKLNPYDSSTATKLTGTMNFPGSYHRKSVQVYQGQRLNMATKQHTQCWFVRNNGRHLLDGRANNYKVESIAYDKLAPGLLKKMTLL